MDDDQVLSLEEQQALILKKIATAEGAFKATGYLGGALIFMVVSVALYGFNKIEKHSAQLSKHHSRISVVESQLNLLEKTRFNK